MMKRLIVIMFALAAAHVPAAGAASLTIFAYDGAGRPVLEFDPATVLRSIGKYRMASVRLQELGGAQLPDGRHIDARDAVWVIDCENKLGAVAYERAFVTVGTKTKPSSRLEMKGRSPIHLLWRWAG
jgi:hypothetical protein